MNLAEIALLQAVLTVTHVIIVVLVLVLLFGAEKIPKLMRNMGSGLNEFKKGLKEGTDAEKAKAAEEKPQEVKKDEAAPKS